MSRALQIAEFVAFVVVFLVYFNRAGQLSLSTGTHQKWWHQQLRIVGTVLSLFAFLYLLAGLFSPTLLLVYLIGYEFALVLSLILVSFLGPAPPNWVDNITWVNYRTSRLYPWPVVLTLVVAIVSIFAYPVVAGIVEFTHDRGSADLTNLVLRVTLLMLVLGGSLFALLSTAMALASEDLDERVRLRFLVSLAYVLGVYALNVAVAAWAFGLNGPGVQVGRLVLSIQVTVGTVALFAITVILPYLLGNQRGKAWNVTLLEQRGNKIDDLLKIIDLPNVDQYAPKLTSLHAEVDNEYGELNKQVSIPPEGKDPAIFKTWMRDIRNAYQSSRLTDVRLRYIEWLREFAENMRQMLAELEAPMTPDDSRQAAARWAEPYRRMRSEIDSDIEKAQKQKTGLRVIAGLLLTPPVLGVVSNSLGHSFWGEFLRSLAH